MWNEFDNEFGPIGFDVNPGRQTLVACGYDPDCYISTAQIAPTPYVSIPLIQAKFQGANSLISAVDDTGTGSIDPNNPPSNPAYATLLNIIQNVTTEINGYLSSVYPIPLVQTGTITIIKITGVSTDGLGKVTAIQVLEPGNYQTTPATPNSPAYLRHLDSDLNESLWGHNWQSCQLGTGLQLTVAFAGQNYSDESGQILQAQAVSGTPTIANAGLGYEVGQLVVLIGGQSFVPAKIREAALSLVCHDLLQRRLTPNEQNLYTMNNKLWRGTTAKDGLLLKIGNEDIPLDGTYKRFYSPIASWNSKSVLFGANSL